ncbi:MAG: SDR family oxidoreductase [Saprospiraceae bacterium]|nr:SDR family oxidoreductase [Saprospiraceae bacterium]
MKNFLIVGGTKGIGRAVVENLSSQGHNVYALARHAPDFALPGVQFRTMDIVSDDMGSLQLPEVLDGMVYCPGTINLKPFKSVSDTQILEEFQVNVLGAVRVLRHTLPFLKNSSFTPGIVLFSTVAVQQGMPFHSSIAMAKGAVEGLTRSLAAELAPRIRVNCIAPSLTDTPLAERLLSSPEKKEGAAGRHPLKKIGNPSEIAALASFLLSEDASWITGQIIHMDGGLSSLRL